MKKIKDILSNVMIFFAILPLFFANEIYPNYVYYILFIYFLINFIYNLKKKNYEDKNKIFFFVDLIVIFSFISKYKYIVLLRLIILIKFAFKIKGFRIISDIIVENSSLFITIYSIVLIYITIIALLLFQIEPQTFDYSYFNALYWAGISLATVGYGDIYPITVIGKTLGVITSLVGIAIVALPIGVISTKFMEKIKNNEK